MALTKITGQVINDTTGLVVGVTTVGGGVSATDGFFSGIVTAVGDASFSGNVSVGGTLTYEDVTNIDAVGLVTARNGIVVGSGITLSKDGDIFATGITTISENLKVGTGVTISPDGDGFFTGVVTATSYAGDGSNLTGITAGTTLSGSTDNTVCTVTGANAIQGESNVQIDSSGRLLIGTTTGGQDDADEITISGTRTGMTIRSADDDYGNIFFSDATSGTAEYIGAVQYYHADNTMRFKTNSTDRVRIESGGNLKILDGDLVIGASGHGIDFSDTSDASGMSSELLDDYEEGTWTPGMQMDGGGASFSYSTQLGTYTRIGRMVHFECYIVLSNVAANGSGSYLKLTGLPFNSMNSSTYGGMHAPWYNSMNNTPLRGALVERNDNFAYMYMNRETDGTIDNATTAGLLGSTSRFALVGSYQTP